MSSNKPHDHFRQLLLDNDIPESKIECLIIQNGWSTQQIVEWYIEQGMLEIIEDLSGEPR